MAETRLKITYSVTSTTYSTQLFKTSYFSKAELEDGTELPSNIFDVGNHAYVFSATGNNVVFFTLTGNTIGDEAFEGMTRIVSADIPSTVTTLGERCFRNCSNLSAISMTSATTAIGAGAFDSTALQSVELPATALTMADRVFYGCTELTSITISAQTAPAVQQYTFHNVHTGGTLYYSAGSDYSAWLSDSPSYLGYYGWTGVEMSGDPDTGSTPDTGTTINLTSDLVLRYSPERIPLIRVSTKFSPDDDVDLEWSSSNTDLFPIVDTATYPSTGSGDPSEYIVNLLMPEYTDDIGSVSGYTTISAIEKNSGVQGSINIYRYPSGQTPNIYLESSAATIPSYASGGNLSQVYYFGDISASGVTIKESPIESGAYVMSQMKREGSTNFQNCYLYPQVLGSDGKRGRLGICQFSENISGVDEYTKYALMFYDEDNNGYLSYCRITQEAGSGYTPDTGTTPATAITFVPSLQGFAVNSIDRNNSVFKLRARVRVYPADADVDFECTSSNPSLVEFVSAGTPTARTDYTEIPVYYNLHSDIDIPSPSGYSVLTITDRNSGLQLSRKVYNYPAAEAPNIYFSPSALTVDWDTSASTSYPLVLGDAVEDDVTISGRTYATVYGPTGGLWINRSTGKLVSTSLTVNYNYTDRANEYRGSVLDSDGNTYIVRFDLTQLKTPVYEHSFAFENYHFYRNMPADRYNYSGMPSDSIPCFLNADFCGTSIDCTAELDTGSTPGLLTIVDSWSGAVTSHADYKSFCVNLNANLNVQGSAAIIITDRISGNQVRRTLHNEPLIPPEAIGYCSPSALTISSAATENANRTIATVYKKSNSLTDDFNTLRGKFINDNITWDVAENPRVGSEIISFGREYEGYSAGTFVKLLSTVANTGDSRTVTLYSTIDKNPTYKYHDDYLCTFALTQEGALTRHGIDITPSTQSVSSADTSVCMSIVAENVTFDHAQVTGTSGNWSPMPTSAVNGNNICFYFDRNQGDSRTANYSVKLYDTDGNSYDASVSLTQEAKDDSYDGNKISHPINNHYSPGMLKLRTTLEDGQVYTTGNASFNPGLGYTKQVCSPYVLYYLNSYGGWDAFVIEGTVIKKETINSYMTDRAFNNTTIEFETNKYVNEIKTNYELNTGLLSDEESANLAKNLLGSLKVYMHNLDEGWVKPVIIMDNNITYQTYQTNGKKLSQYRINVQMSQSKIRK